MRARWLFLIEVTISADLPRLAGTRRRCDMTWRHRSKRGHGEVLLDDVLHMPDHDGARFVRVVHPVTDRPTVVSVVDDLPRRLLPLQDRALDDSTKVGGELVGWARKRNVPKHLLRYRRTRHAVMMPDPRKRPGVPDASVPLARRSPVSPTPGV